MLSWIGLGVQSKRNNIHFYDDARVDKSRKDPSFGQMDLNHRNRIYMKINAIVSKNIQMTFIVSKCTLFLLRNDLMPLKRLRYLEIEP